MDLIIQNSYIPHQLLHFIAGPRCCQQFACTFRTIEQSMFLAYAQKFCLRSQCVAYDGQKCVKVYKRQCKHYLEEPQKLILCSSTVIEMLTLLRNSIFLNNFKEMNTSSNCMGRPRCRVFIPQLDLSLMALGPRKSHVNTKALQDYLKRFPGHTMQNVIIQSISANRVVLFDAELSWDKSVLLPVIILDDCEKQKACSKIICVEKEEILAVYNSKRLAKILEEDVGETVGVQVPEHNITSYMSKIIFTTAQHFLRSLMSQSNVSKFRHISHLVVNDVHLHDPYIDILLSELRCALIYNKKLKTIFLSQGAVPKFVVTFFGEGTELFVERMPTSDTCIVYLEDIHRYTSSILNRRRSNMVYNDLPKIFDSERHKNVDIDKCLEAYEEIGTDAAFRPFLYGINFEMVSVNHRHSINGKTAIQIASKLNNVNHFRLLLLMGADPFITDELQQNALTFALFPGHNECLKVLNIYIRHGHLIRDAKPEFVDFDLIVNVMHLLRTSLEFPSGNILIILPTYYHLVKLNYMLLRDCLIGDLQAISIFLLYSNMDEKYLDALVEAPQNTIKVVLATDVIESLPLPLTFEYIIDSACRKSVIYDCRTYSNADIYEWVAKDCLLRRASIIKNKAATEPRIFRLISKDRYNNLQESSIPDLLTMPLDKICLAVKLLSPSTMISEYLSIIIVPPPLVNVHQTVQLLKKIDVLDETEEITWLGCRLLDLPLPCQLGRTLVFGILLQCLDPVLTIVSALSISDPLGVPFKDDIDYVFNNFTTCIQKRIISERYLLAEDQQSDHYIFIRLFNEWQNRFTNGIDLCLTDEYDFIFNGLMEQLNATRCKLLNALRSAKLVQSQGQLSMQSINRKSSSWPTVKAALTGGMYPNIYVVDHKMNCMRSAYSMKVPLHPNTVLRKPMEPYVCYAKKLKTAWVVLTKHMNHQTYATVTMPLAVILLTGSRKLQCGQFTEEQNPFDNHITNFFIDEWIWMSMPKSYVDLIIKTRQYFFLAYNNLLQNCTDSAKWTSHLPAMKHYQMLTDTLTNVFAYEDFEAGFQTNLNININCTTDKQPYLYLLLVNSQFSCEQHFAINVPYERQFFLLYTKQSPSDFYQRSCKSYIENVIGKFIRPIQRAEKHIFVILYGKNPDLMYSVSQVKCLKGEIVFKEYFRNTIPIREILEACATLRVSKPSFDGRPITCLIDIQIGDIIMNLFAFRNHWIHNKYVQDQRKY